MAAREVRELEPETGRDLCRVGREEEWRGYRKDILTENMSERGKILISNQAMMCRESILGQNEQKCSERNIECLIAEYKCDIKTNRTDLSQHLEEDRIGHLELKVNALEAVIERQNETIEKLNRRISEQNQKKEKIGPLAMIEKELKALSDSGVLPRYKAFDDSSDSSDSDEVNYMACTYFQRLAREKLKASVGDWDSSD